MNKNNELDIQVELTEGDIEIIKRYVNKIQFPDVYVELGTAQGGSALVAREATNKDVEIYSIDILDRLHSKARNRTDIKFIVSPSVEVAKIWDGFKKIKVLFIDANHDKAKEDFLVWEKHLTKDAIVIFHDYAVHSPQVVMDCDELFNNNPNYEILFVPDSSINRTGITSIYQVQKLGTKILE